MSTYTPDTIKLRARLAELGLSQRGAAAALGIPERTMRRYVQGDTPVPALMWHALNGLPAQRYVIRWTRSAESIYGPASELLARGDEVRVFASYEAAEAYLREAVPTPVANLTWTIEDADQDH